MIQEFFKIDSGLSAIAERCEKKCRPALSIMDEIAEYNGWKVLAAFGHQGVAESHFAGTSGYGYGDRGREVLDALFAEIFGTEDALVRHNFVSGTHALATALYGVLRPGDKMVSAAGRPYDTMEEVIGLAGEKGMGSLMEYGILYDEIELHEDGTPDLCEIEKRAKDAKMIYIQRSRGYSLRPSLTVKQIGEMADAAHRGNPKVIVMVDNCYGEFVEKTEPTQVGADLAAGSLIKNPGGGIADTGGYIVGRRDLIEKCAYRLTVPGAGKEVGCTLGQTKKMMLGLFMAPNAAASAVKTAIFASALFEELGYKVLPRWDDPRTDIIESVLMGNADALCAFCEGIQKGAAVDSFVTPEPWEMPGYDSKVIMAAGAFNMGSSIELSADAPLREPYAVWLQGGLTYPTGKAGVLLAAQSMLDRGFFTLPA